MILAQGKNSQAPATPSFRITALHGHLRMIDNNNTNKVNKKYMYICRLDKYVVPLVIVITVILNAMNKEQRNTTGLNLVIPADLSARLSHKVIDIRLHQGIDISKAELILEYAQRGLSMDQDSVRRPIEITNK